MASMSPRQKACSPFLMALILGAVLLLSPVSAAGENESPVFDETVPPIEQIEDDSSVDDVATEPSPDIPIQVDDVSDEAEDSVAAEDQDSLIEPLTREGGSEDVEEAESELRTGALVAGWVVDSGSVYYLDPETGEMASGGLAEIRGLCAPLAAADGVPFSDVGDSTPHAEDIAWMLSSGISTGWSSSDGTRSYRPSSTVARADMAAFLYRLAGSPDFYPSEDDLAYFSDVTTSTPHASEIWWLASMGISTGWESADGTRSFRPSAAVARADMAAFLYRLAGSPSLSYGESAGFADVSDGTAHAAEIRWLAASGISTGWESADGTRSFRPSADVARADMAAFLHRMVSEGAYEPSAVHTYLFASDGRVVSGWADVDGSQHFFNRLTGAMVRGGIFAADGSTYCFADDGSLRYGWVDSSGSTYYFDPSTGEMMTGWFELDGDRFYSDSNGRLYSGGFFVVDGLTRYFKSNGALAIGWVVDDGSVYYLDPETSALATSGLREIPGFGAPLAVAGGASFADVDSSISHAEDIEWMLWSCISEGWVSSDGTRTFRPSATVTRADMAAFLYRLAGSPDYFPSAGDTSFFEDVSTVTPHATEIWWLAKSGISEGWLSSDGTRTFRPSATVTRGDMAAFLYRLAGKPDYSSGGSAGFADVSDGTAHAAEIRWLAASGISTGWESADGTRSFRPSAAVARADMAAFLHRMVSKGVFEPSTVHDYLISNDGRIVSGWANVGGARRFFSRTTGAMVRCGIFNADGSTYCFADDGSLRYGWVEFGGSTYYFDPSTGKMYRKGTYVIEGKTCYFDADGHMSTAPRPWSLTDAGWVNGNGQVIPGAIGKGVDVSEWNGTIDWEKVKADGITFAILRVGYGLHTTAGFGLDAEFQRNASECERLGIPYGVYVYSYATNASQAAKEADGVINALKGHTLSYPVYMDVEDTTTQGNLKPSDFATIATTFCTRIEAAGYQPGVYSMLSWWEVNFTSPVFNRWSKWIAQIYSECEYSGSYRLWQCSWEGRVAGITGDVDLDIEFYEQIGGSSTPSTGRVLDDGVYEIAPASSPTLVLAVEGASTADRANISLATDANTSSQRFRLTWDVSQDAYMIENVNSGCVLDLAGSEAVIGANIQQYHAVGWLDQRWVITSASGGYRIASAVNPSYYLCLGSSTPRVGTNVQLGNSSSATTFQIRAV